MTTDDLTAPLGQQQKKRRWRVPFTASQVIAAALTLFLGAFVLWAVTADDPFGGEPMAIAPTHLAPTKPAAKTADAQPPSEVPTIPNGAVRYDAQTGQPIGQAGQGAAAPPANTKTVTIIDGKTGERHEVVIPAPTNDTEPTSLPATDQKFVEITPHGAIPKIAADGTRPAEAFARPVSQIPGKPDAPRIAIVIGGLGVSMNTTADAIAKLPGAVTLGFMPYADNVAALA